MNSEQPSRVSVLICTAGRPDLLNRALARLAGGHERPEQLVVVNGGDKRANDVVARHSGAFEEVILVQYQNRNLAASRNLGLLECTGDIIAMTDDDAIVALDWIQQMRRAHSADQAAGALGGPVVGPSDEGFLSRVADRVVFPAFPTRRRARTLPGVNVAYKRRAVQEVGTFDESLFRGEDVDFNWRVIGRGYDLVYDPDIRVEHKHRSTLLGLLQQQWMYGRAYVLVRGKWPDMYSVYPHHLRTLRDWAKLFHCGLAVAYQPALAARHMGTPREALPAYPLLVLHHLTWKIAMLYEATLRRYKRLMEAKTSTVAPAPSLRHRWVHGELELSNHGLKAHVRQWN